MSIRGTRDVIATYFQTLLEDHDPPVSVTVHGGDFKKEDLQRYAKTAPALIVSVLRHHTFENPPDLVVEVGYLVTLITRPRKGENRNDSALDLSELVATVVKRSPWLADIRGTRRPADVDAKNLFHPELDALGVAMWAVAWGQIQDLVEDAEEAVPFETLHADWDLSPQDDGADLGDQLEAQDDVELEQV